MSSERRVMETAATWAEIVGAVAVVASLLYVGSEVRRNTAVTQAATYQEVVHASNEYLLALASDSSLADIIVRAESEDPPSLSAVEGLRYFSYLRVFWRNMDNAFVQHRRGVLADSEWEVYLGIACYGRLNRPTWSWDMNRSALSPEFVALIDDC